MGGGGVSLIGGGDGGRCCVGGSGCCGSGGASIVYDAADDGPSRCDRRIQLAGADCGQQDGAAADAAGDVAGALTAGPPKSDACGTGLECHEPLTTCGGCGVAAHSSC